MASLSVRKLDDQVYERLRLQSLKHHVSMEEEARQIIARAVATPDIRSVFAECFGEKNGIDLELPQHKAHKPLDFKE